MIVFPEQRPLLRIQTAKPIAFDSPDHLNPWGTKNDNHTNRHFLKKIFWWLKYLKVLDLGCSGGGFVKSVIDHGGFAVGIEGSDYSLKHQRAEWRTIPGNLFTADITEPFQVLSGEKPVKFNCITAWEVLEHLPEEKLEQAFENFNKHLEKQGVIIMSVGIREEFINGVRLHQTVKPKNWWLEKFRQFGWEHHEKSLSYFDTDYVRWEPKTSFYTILTRTNDELPFKIKFSLLNVLIQPFNFLSRAGKVTKKLIIFLKSILKKAFRRNYFFTNT